jgi:hypothetical protein
MQYILSEEEYRKLKSIQDIELAIQKKELQDLCTKIADTMPVIIEWSSDPEVPKVWGCILTRKSGYCDRCPVRSICPCSYKDFSQ